MPQNHGKLPMKPGLVFPVHPLDGSLFYRLRPDNPGRLPKYLQPKGMPNRLDIHPRQHERIKRPGGIRYLTEGEKKVDAGVSRGLLMVGVSGVFNGQRDKGAGLIDDWQYLPLEGEKYSITLDSDIETNPMIQLGACRYDRLLREAGAEVFITLLPPAPDGSKQGLDDFFANGGTVKELEMLTRPFDLEVVEATRLSRDEKLANGIADLERRFWAEEWTGMGGHSDRDIALKLIEAARRHGKVHPDGIRVEKAQGPLAIEAKVSSRTLWKSLNRLEGRGFCYRDNEGRKPDKSGAFVLRASVSQYGGSSATEGNVTPGLQGGVPGDLHLRAPRLRWSRPKYTPKRGTVRGTRRVRQSQKLEPRDQIKRLGKIRCAIIDALDKEGRAMDINELAAALKRRRARDLVRRKETPKGHDGPVIMLEEAGIVTVSEADNVVSLTDDWLERLDEARELGGEREADEVARERYKIKSKAYRNRNKTEPDHHYANVGADGFVEDLEPEEAPAASAATVAAVSPLAAAIRDYLAINPGDACEPPGWIGSTLWALDLYPGKPTPAEARVAIAELGGERYLKERLGQAREAAA